MKKQFGIFYHLFAIYLIVSNLTGITFIGLTMIEELQYLSFTSETLITMALLSLPTVYFIYAIITGVQLLQKNKTSYKMGQILNITDIVLGIIYTVAGLITLILGCTGYFAGDWLDLTVLAIAGGISLIVTGLSMSVGHFFIFKYFKKIKENFI